MRIQAFPQVRVVGQLAAAVADEFHPERLEPSLKLVQLTPHLSQR